MGYLVQRPTIPTARLAGKKRARSISLHFKQNQQISMTGAQNSTGALHKLLRTASERGRSLITLRMAARGRHKDGTLMEP
jgi:hypothetical protein